MSLSITSGSQDPYSTSQLLAAQQAGAMSGACQGGAQQSSGNVGPTATQGQTGHHHHHYGPGGGAGDAVSKLLDIIGNALQQAQSTGQDPNKVIEDTVAQLLEGKGGGGATTGTTTPGTTDATTAATPPTMTTTANPLAAGQTFTQLLQSVGVDLNQFRTDLLAAVQDAQQGQVNPATALQSVPAGSSIDAIA